MFLLYSVFDLSVYVLIFLFEQKTAYEVRISDVSSDVCSSDLRDCLRDRIRRAGLGNRGLVLAPTRVSRRCRLGQPDGLARTDDPRPRPPGWPRTRRAAQGVQGLRHIVYALYKRLRSEERRFGTECVSPRRSRWSQCTSKK